MPLVPIDNGAAGAVALVSRDAPPSVLAREDGAIVIERMAVGEIRRPVEIGDAIGRRPAVDDVASPVAPDDGFVGRLVDGPFSPETAAREPDELRIGRDEGLE